MDKRYFWDLKKMFGGIEEILEVQEKRPLFFYGASSCNFIYFFFHFGKF